MVVATIKYAIPVPFQNHIYSSWIRGLPRFRGADEYFAVNATGL